MTLIYDKRLIKEWIDEVVPEPEGDEVFIAILCARKKYSPAISRSEEMLDKVILKGDKSAIYRRLCKFLRVEEGDYIDFNSKKSIPLDAMVVYFDLYPKSTLKAISPWFKTINQWLYDAINNPEFNRATFRKIDTKLFSAIAKSNSRKPVRVVDIDNKDKIYDVLPLVPEPEWITETRGGWHLIYQVTDKNRLKELGKIYHELVSKEFKGVIEIQWHQAQTVIPGTMQGGFKVTGFSAKKEGDRL